MKRLAFKMYENVEADGDEEYSAIEVADNETVIGIIHSDPYAPNIIHVVTSWEVT